jgi:hypothetical protein
LQSILAEDSTQINAPAEQEIEERRRQAAMDAAIRFDPTMLSVTFAASSKNLALIRVLNDNRKSLERRILPLLEMFKVETTFFK